MLVVKDIVGNLRSHLQDNDVPPEPPNDDPFAVDGADGDSEGEPEAADAEGERDEEKWEEIVKGNNTAVEVPFMIPLPNKSAPEVLQGICDTLVKSRLWDFV